MKINDKITNKEPICKDCQNYNPYFFLVYNQPYNKSECKLTKKKVTQRKQICKYYKGVTI